MVYNGPSRGCHMCRKRRIKCDETKPACNRCIKSGRNCPGFRQELGLVSHMEIAAELKTARYATKDTIIPSTLRPPFEDQAACYFMSNFVLNPTLGGAPGFMNFLTLLRTMNHVPKHFEYAFDACTLAFLNNREDSRNIFEKEALGKYAKALSATFSALRDPELAKQDVTLASVLLLGLFEQIAPTSMSWSALGSHIEGAYHLAMTRGDEQLRTNIGLEMFISVRSRMIIVNLLSSKHLALDVDWQINDMVDRDPTFKVQQLSLMVGELRSEANRLLTNSTHSSVHVNKVFDLLRRCQAHEVVCENWARTLPEIYQFKLAAWEDNVPNGDYTKAEVYPGRVDAYQSLSVVHMWNIVRCARLALASIIVRCAAWKSAPIDYRKTEEYSASVRTCSAIITDIIASVPYQLGWFSKRQDLLHEKGKFSTFECGEDNVQKGLGGYMATMPLVCVVMQDYTTTVQRIWAHGRLHHIGSHLGIRSSHSFAQLNVRMPSMLICRNGIIASPCPPITDIDQLLTT
ncbi:hypothetical protein HIM_06246 [Hirsutella minnesotensis 3608]|uniref:Zn(2)-C6 fungal-type domain-containing protein n=1 Tax=Hirsutella minnesotensis 3608 TaxID=1043627 RepID=A0A0F7ZJI1_9HYPO|nr:hypothetical protein HIM_06246 [Hirsutella minnesotensis 3608]